MGGENSCATGAVIEPGRKVHRMQRLTCRSWPAYIAGVEENGLKRYEFSLFLEMQQKPCPGKMKP